MYLRKLNYKANRESERPAKTRTKSSDKLVDAIADTMTWEEKSLRAIKSGDLCALVAASRMQSFSPNIQRQRNGKFGWIKVYKEGWGATIGKDIILIPNVEEGDTLGHFAARTGTLSSVGATLAELGVDLSVRNSKGESPSSVLVRNSSTPHKGKSRKAITPVSDTDDEDSFGST